MLQEIESLEKGLVKGKRFPEVAWLSDLLSLNSYLLTEKGAWVTIRVGRIGKKRAMIKEARERGWMTTGEIAKLLNISIRTVVRYMKRQKDPIPFEMVNIGRGWRKVMKYEFEEWRIRNGG